MAASRPRNFWRAGGTNKDEETAVRTIAAAARPFTVSETHGILLRPDHRIVAASDQLGWKSLYASVQRTSPHEAAYAGVPDHLIILHLDGPVAVSRILHKCWASRVIPPGGLFILPGGVDFGVRLGGELSTLHLYVRHAIVEEVAAELSSTDARNIELLPRLGVKDPMIERLALEVRDALTDPDPSVPIYIDYLTCAIAARLVRAHSTRSMPRSEARAGLTRIQLDRAINYMEENLDKPLALLDVAHAVGLGVTHFARRFKQSTGRAPHQYLMRCRVERARRLLAETDNAIAQIAFACGFAHQEHLTRIFRRLNGETPAKFRRGVRD
jgi:AraC family transcriptional regulator